VLEIDPDTIGQAVYLFERYALGTISIKQLAAETGLEAMRIQQILRNPIYNGWMRRHRGPDEERRPAAWRSDPPVDDELWATAERVRRRKSRGGGPRKRGRVDLLAGLLECSCERRIRSDGRFSDGRHRELHPGQCEKWGQQARCGDEVWEGLAAFDEPQAGHVPAKRAAAWLQALGETLRSADVPEAKVDLIHAIYERIVVAGPEFIRAYLTPAAYAHGLAALLPEVVIASSAGFKPVTGRPEGIDAHALCDLRGGLCLMRPVNG